MGRIKPDLNKQVNLISRYGERADASTDPRAMTLLRSKGIPQTKVYGAGLKKVKAWSNAKIFHPYIAVPGDIHELSAVLTEAAADQNICIVRGYLVNPAVTETTRDKDVIKDTARHCLMVDLDGFMPPTEFNWRDDLPQTAKWAVMEYLPEPFWNAAFHYSFSSSAGTKKKKGLRLHLWFWLETPADSKTLKKYFKPFHDAWLTKYNPGKLKDEDIETDPEKYKDLYPSFLDLGIYDSIQVHYNALPKFEVPSEDPFAGRSRHGLVAEGRDLTVALPSPKVGAQEWVPSREDLLAMIPALILHYPKMVDKWDGAFPSPWKKMITGFKHHLVKVLGAGDDEAFDWVEREFSQKLPGATDQNRDNWNKCGIDLPPGEGGQITVWSLVKLAEEEGYRRPVGVRGAVDTGFMNDWLYAVAIKQFVNAKSLLEYDKEQFNAVFLSYFERGQPHEIVLRNSIVKTINSTTYWPCHGRFVEEAAFHNGSAERN
jgi:hypothetical protein